MEKEDIISVQRAQEDVETSYNLLNNNNNNNNNIYIYIYIYIYIMFVVNNRESLQTNSSAQGMNTRKKLIYKGLLQILHVYKKGVSYSCIKIFNSLSTNILELKNEKLLRKYLITHSSYSVEDS